MIRCFVRALLPLCMFAATPARPQGADASAIPPPDDRFKADVLVIVAHPDDETAVAPLLAKLVLDDHRKTAIVYCNRGSGGGNSIGMEQSTAMGLEREIEARRASGALGIHNVWFLGGRDTPGQDVFASLANWHHGEVLEEVVRIVRLTRPEVIVTWLPDYVAGENHGDHQASGVIAVEAFDCAGDPTVFPVQVTPPRERGDINNFTEGLHPWQPEKIYFFSDATRPVRAEGPAFSIEAMSPSRKVPYYRIAAAADTFHLTQGDVSQGAIDAIRSGNFSAFIKEMGKFNLIFGKAVVPCSAKGDLFEGVTRTPSEFVRCPGFRPEPHRGVSLELGGAFAFYRDFWRTHALERLNGLVEPEVEIAAGSILFMPLLIRNATPDTAEIILKADLPSGWKPLGGEARYRVAPGEAYPVSAFLTAPGDQREEPQHITWHASAGTSRIGSATMTVHLRDWTLPQ